MLLNKQLASGEKLCLEPTGYGWLVYWLHEPPLRELLHPRWQYTTLRSRSLIGSVHPQGKRFKPLRGARLLRSEAAPNGLYTDLDMALAVLLDRYRALHPETRTAEGSDHVRP